MTDEPAFATGQTLWEEAAHTFAGRTFLVAEGRSWTYAEADDAVLRCAATLRGLGIRPGELVLVGGSTSSTILFTQMAVRELGAVMVALVSGLTWSELRYQVEHSGATALIADSDVASAILPHLDELPQLSVVVADNDEPRAVVSLDELFRSEPLSRDLRDTVDDLAPSIVMYTSGSTAMPKAVVLPAGSFASGGAGWADRFEIKGDDNFFLPMTLAHGLGGMLVPSIVMRVGATLTLEPRFRPSTFWRSVIQAGCTVTFLFPAQLNLLLTSPETATMARKSRLRLVITHAWNQEFVDKTGVQLATAWGSSETGTLGAASTPDYDGAGGDGFLGRPLPQGAEMCAFSSDGRALPPGEPGELGFRHRHMMLSYLGDPALTATTVVDGWLRTGDYGRIDVSGDVFFLGRVKNMIKRSGENISPEEVEWVVSKHPGVQQCMAFGVPDALRTEELALLVAVESSTELTPEDIRAFAGERLVRWKLPRYISIQPEELPTVGSGKVDRAAVINTFSPSDWWDFETAVSDGHGTRRHEQGS